jgi:probable HAF family extracellular repeat protein
VRRNVAVAGLAAIVAGMAAGTAGVPGVASADVVRHAGVSAINNPGQAVGWSTTGTGDTHAALWTRSGQVADLGTLGGTESWAFGVNDLGEVVGHSRDASGTKRAFLWTEATGMRDLGGPPGTRWCEAYDINDRSQVVGRCEVTRPDGSTPYEWETLGDINGSGEAASSFSTSGGHARLLRPTTAGGYDDVDLGTLPAGVDSFARDINERGEMAGGAFFGGPNWAYHAVVWSPGGIIQDLGTLGGTSSTASGVNDRGEVVGESAIASGELRGFRWSGGTMTQLDPLP